MFDMQVELEAMVETVARKLAAERMALRKDTEGLKLPDDLWVQAIPQARELLSLD
jgi:hypothetical protein